MNWHDTQVAIRYADTDQMGVVHHATYPIYCEIGRTDLITANGLAYQELEAAGIFLMVAEMTCRFKAPARYGDGILVRTRIAELKPKLIQFEYQIVCQNTRQLLFTGNTKHLFTKGTKGIIRCPEPYWHILDKLYSANL